ncbi:fumarylacetoacetate hydrolase family protein [Oceanobacter mangrovi]|uniref:fumarylacetoacetate hydrolase family protein n=1 Tax=Oceanobacter mangrovi TaxID=2862510 RepID=UPI001C8D1A48|nr:fumarylacetoacetate hydrolase family protein [Oceanobacter mangrovi]
MYTPILDAEEFLSPTGKVVCVGRNYAAHAAELNNPVPQQPLLFIKPADAVVDMAGEFAIPTGQGSVHYELEIALLLGKKLKNADAAQALAAIAGVGLALDLTLRDVQSGLKDKAHPWERAKAFDGSCPVSPFVSASKVTDWANIGLQLDINGASRQDGSSAAMLFPIAELLVEMSRCFTLNPGDIIITGTPEGVGELKVGDAVQARLQDWLSVDGVVTAAE